MEAKFNFRWRGCQIPVSLPYKSELIDARKDIWSPKTRSNIHMDDLALWWLRPEFIVTFFVMEYLGIGNHKRFSKFLLQKVSLAWENENTNIELLHNFTFHMHIDKIVGHFPFSLES